MDERTLEANGELLTTSQEWVIKRLKQRITEIAESAGSLPVGQDASSSRGFANDNRVSPYPMTASPAHGHLPRSNNFFLIDGSRGSGKSWVLRQVFQYFDTLPAESGGHRGVVVPAKIEPAPSATAIALPVLYPDLLENDEAGLMEHVFAHLDLLLKRRLVLDAGASESDWLLSDLDEDWSLDATHSQPVDARSSGGLQPASEPPETRIRRLRAELKDQVAAGWVFAQPFGQEVLSKDSVDFPEYVRRRFKEGARSARRYQIWNSYVERLLDSLGTRLLMVFIDDCDLSPRSGRAVLHTMYRYLWHPRIVVLLAGNFESLYRQLTLAQLEPLASIWPVILGLGWPRTATRAAEGSADSELTALARGSALDADAMLRSQRQEVAGFVGKLLPATQRFSIGGLALIDALRLIFHRGRQIGFSPDWPVALQPRARRGSDRLRRSLFLWRMRFVELLTAFTTRDLLILGEQLERLLEQDEEPDSLLPELLLRLPSLEGRDGAARAIGDPLRGIRFVLQQFAPKGPVQESAGFLGPLGAELPSQSVLPLEFQVFAFAIDAERCAWDMVARSRPIRVERVAPEPDGAQRIDLTRALQVEEVARRLAAGGPPDALDPAKPPPNCLYLSELVGVLRGGPLALASGLDIDRAGEPPIDLRHDLARLTPGKFQNLDWLSAQLERYRGQGYAEVATDSRTPSATRAFVLAHRIWILGKALRPEEAGRVRPPDELDEQVYRRAFLKHFIESADESVGVLSDWLADPWTATLIRVLEEGVWTRPARRRHRIADIRDILVVASYQAWAVAQGSQPMTGAAAVDNLARRGPRIPEVEIGSVDLIAALKAARTLLGTLSGDLSARDRLLLCWALQRPLDMGELDLPTDMERATLKVLIGDLRKVLKGLPHDPWCYSDLLPPGDMPDEPPAKPGGAPPWLDRWVNPLMRRYRALENTPSASPLAPQPAKRQAGIDVQAWADWVGVPAAVIAEALAAVDDVQ